jgi:hypothetical protein
MIRPLRRRHLVIAIVLAVLLPILFALGLAARRKVPAQPLPVLVEEPR